MELKECSNRRETDCSVVMIDDDDIPEGVWMEIFSRLPLRTKIQLRCVSKRWHSLISDTYMSVLPPWDILFRYKKEDQCIHAYHVLGKFTGLYIVSKKGLELSSPGFSLEFLTHVRRGYYPLRVLGSSNGLILCCKRVHTQTDYYVCNTITARWLSLPKPLCTENHVNVGLSSQDGGGYKVVRIIRHRQMSNILDVEVFSPDTGKWKSLKVSCPRYIRMMSYYQAEPFRGVLHWIAYPDLVVAYDPNRNLGECRLIDLPKSEGYESFGKQVLGTCAGQLRYFRVERTTTFKIQQREGLPMPFNRRDRYLSSWTLVDYDSGEWSLDFRTKVNDLHQSALPLAFHPFDLRRVFMMCGRKIASYNYRSQKFMFIPSQISHLSRIGR
ncbi:unnamed protein product [Cuscuta europaea]|uniref:F-box domain-containing protein n=1 Tax=Cuscuta europaea TaxID=41803 RepID=A0A9P0ZKU5_CUSEU|nr:unnamed protein product [Cuscuta europaea]